MHETPGRFKNFDYNKKIWENDEDFEELNRAEYSYPSNDHIYRHKFRADFINKLKHFDNKLKVEYRENLICKLKKITDTFELRDDTFFRAAFLYDFQDRLQGTLNKTSTYQMAYELEDLFVFDKGEEEELRKYKYLKFFEALACMLIILKFIESDKNTPKTLDLLKFYWAEKLNLTIRDWDIEDEHSLDYKKKKIEIIYDYVWDKQLEINFRLDWKLQTVSISHFLDHYKRILPEIETYKFEEKKDLITPKRLIGSPTTTDRTTGWVSI